MFINEFDQVKLLSEIVEGGDTAKVGEASTGGADLWYWWRRWSKELVEPKYCKTTGRGRPFTRRDSTR